MIKKWWEDRGLKAPSMNDLPEMGIIVNDCVCGFIYVTDSSFGFLDCYSSDPKTSHNQRIQSFKILNKKILETSKRLGIEKLLVHTQIESTKEMARSHDFKSLGEFSMFVKEL